MKYEAYEGRPMKAYEDATYVLWLVAQFSNWGQSQRQHRQWQKGQWSARERHMFICSHGSAGQVSR